MADAGYREMLGLWVDLGSCSNLDEDKFMEERFLKKRFFLCIGENKKLTAKMECVFL
jgi:hypothetical protein